MALKKIKSSEKRWAAGSHKASGANSYFKTGDHYVWLNAGAIAIALIMVVGLLLLIAVNGMRHFWAHELVEQTIMVDGESQTLLGAIIDHDSVQEDGKLIAQTLMRVGNRDVYGQDFRWVHDADFGQRTLPYQALVIERTEWGPMYGYLAALSEAGVRTDVSDPVAGLVAMRRLLERAEGLRSAIHDIEYGAMNATNTRLSELNLQQRKRELAQAEGVAMEADELSAVLAQAAAEVQGLQSAFAEQQTQLAALHQQLQRDSVEIRLADGQVRNLSIAKVLHVHQPNALTLADKWGYFGHRIWEFLSENPRESNTEGGVFPAIFGTVTMVLLMSIIVTPFGVIAAVYLHEYAKQNWFTRLIRIAVNNLAGVPSIVYGVFGLGFFVYFLGGNIDDAFFAAAKPTPTFGTPGLLWASLTLALLTLPVVIVSTEEGLARIPKAIREGSLALGATKIETLWRTVLPMASPAMMTGLILAVARAAGEVAPLMLVGVVKLSQALPIDGVAPFLHLDRKFMHLGFQIYDVGFQSPNIEAARPLVYASALLLVLVTVLLNVAAIKIRNHLREKYKSLEH